MKAVIFLPLSLLLLLPGSLSGQTEPVYPSLIVTGEYLGLTPPLRDLPAISEMETMKMRNDAAGKILNSRLRTRSYPYADQAFPKGADPVWQKASGTRNSDRAPDLNISGQDSPFYPSDPTGAAGPGHYMQAVNAAYTIYDKNGVLLAGPTALNTLFEGVAGSECNSGDPIVLYDEQAGRWLVAEFSICGVNDFVLIAISTTSDPTGAWHKYSFDVDDIPDYEKFGIWRDGYYMGINNAVGNDIYVFERSQMLIGGEAVAVAFNNPWRPATMDGFMCVPPLDNDGDFAPEGEPGLFITINDDAISGGSDQLWIYELSVNWAQPGASTFIRAQQLSVAPFDSNFGSTWENISQYGTTRKLDAVPQVIMNPPQYRNFGTYETIVCCHTVDVDNSDHAGVRWYELRRAGGGAWSVRQQGTYAPDEHSRWMGSIMMNGMHQIALGYSISGSNLHPGIRYCGQSEAANLVAGSVLDIAEDTIHHGQYSQLNINRWGDYAAMQVDPSDDMTFWFTSGYVGPSGARKTMVSSFNFGTIPLEADFKASDTTPSPETAVLFNDYSLGNVRNWQWNFSPNTITYLNGTDSTSRYPAILFNNSGYYSVSLTVSDSLTDDTEMKSDYIFAYTPGLWKGIESGEWNNIVNWDGGKATTSSTNVVIPPDAYHWPEYTGNFVIGTHCSGLSMDNSSEMNISGSLTINPGNVLTMNENAILKIGGSWINNGAFNPGNSTVSFIGPGPLAIASTLNPNNITDYVRSTFPKEMNYLVNGITGPSGDDKWENVPLGFTFKFAGNNYTSARLSTNGWLSLNLSGNLGYNNNYLFTSSVPNCAIAAWWDDLYDDAVSSVNYLTEGSEPNRVFTAEWNRLKPYMDNSVTARISFQVKLYETSNIIEFHYGNAEPGTHSSYESASIGIEDHMGGPGHFKEATTGSTTTGVTSLSSLTQWQLTNYRFAPADLTQRFNNVILSNPEGILNFTTDTEIDGFFELHPGASTIINTGKTLKVRGNLE